MKSVERPPLVVHLVYRLSVGGLENGLVNLVNRLPAELARHCIVSLTDIDTGFARRITRPDVELVALHKKEGQTFAVLPRLFRLLRERRPSIVHTRNISTLECQLAAVLARVPSRIHGEHGWDVADQYGSNRRYTRLRRWFRHLVHQYVALSRPTLDYLRTIIGVPEHRVRALYNGVDVVRFSPVDQPAGRLSPFPSGSFVIGTVGRLSSVKNQALLCNAFVSLRDQSQAFRERARLVLVGEGPERVNLEDILRAANALDVCWFAGEREDIPALLQEMNLFCLPSFAEGLSNSILEAMACGLPVVATDVGGNSEQVVSGSTGTIVGDLNPVSFARAIAQYFEQPDLCERHGNAARDLAVSRFSLETMVQGYGRLYAELLPHSSTEIAGRIKCVD